MYRLGPKSGGPPRRGQQGALPPTRGVGVGAPANHPSTLGCPTVLTARTRWAESRPGQVARAAGGGTRNTRTWHSPAPPPLSRLLACHPYGRLADILGQEGGPSRAAAEASHRCGRESVAHAHGDGGRAPAGGGRRGGGRGVAQDPDPPRAAHVSRPRPSSMRAWPVNAHERNTRIRRTPTEFWCDKEGARGGRGVEWGLACQPPLAGAIAAHLCSSPFEQTR